jgi:hypothetical protein
MDWIRIVEWIAAVIVALIAIVALSIAMLSWLLNHPQD